MTETPQEPPALSDAWGPLWGLACGENGERRDWDGFTVKAAMRDADARGVPYQAARATLLRLAGDLGAGTREVVGELGNLCRPAPRQEAAGHGIPADDKAALIAQMHEATRRRMGGIPSRVPAQGAAPETETGNSGGTAS